MKKIFVFLSLLVFIIFCTSCGTLGQIIDNELISEDKDVEENEDADDEEIDEETDEDADENNNTESSGEEQEKRDFQELYKLEKEEYISTINSQIKELEDEKEDLRAESIEIDVSYERQKKYLPQNYVKLGLYGTGAYYEAMEKLEREQRESAKMYSEKINALDTQILELKREKNNPNYKNVLRSLAKNNNITYYEALQKYNKYID